MFSQLLRNILQKGFNKAYLISVNCICFFPPPAGIYLNDILRKGWRNSNTLNFYLRQNSEKLATPVFIIKLISQIKDAFIPNV